MINFTRLSPRGGLCKSWTLDWTRGLDFGLSRLMLPDVTVCKWLKLLFKVTMNKQCARLFIIIFMLCTRKSECIPIVTNFASILANYFYFLRKITAQRPSILNFGGRLVKFCQKSSGQTVKKWLFGRGLRRMLLKILCSAHISSAA